MARIVINENDLTTATRAADNTDIAFVPGLMGTDRDSNGHFIPHAGKYGIPTLCQTVADFEYYFGTNPNEFKNDQIYNNIQLFQNGDFDLGYIYAKELLSAGLQVVYVALTDTSTAYNAVYNAVNETDDSPYKYSPSKYDTYFVKAKYTLLTRDDVANILAGGDIPEEFTFIFSKTDTNYLAVFTNDVKANISTDYGLYYKLDAENIENYYVPTPEQGNQSVSTLNTALPKFLDLFGLYVKENVSSELSGLDAIYNQLYSLFNSETNFEIEVPPLTEKGEYSIKYITSGGYPNYRPKTSDNTNTIGLYSSMISLAEARGDAVALVDTPYEENRTLNPLNSDSVYYQLQNEQIGNGSFGSMVFEPKDTNLINTYIKSTTGKAPSTLIMPGSFSYLKSLASSLKQGNANWLAIAGVTRGLVPNLVSTTLNRLTNTIADYYQGTQPNGEAVKDFKYAINAITNIKPYGYCIWGNRTLASNAGGQKATNYLNIRNAVSDIKKICYTSAKRLMFEQNDDILWTKFLSYITPTLDKMNSGSGISGYKVLKLATNEHAKLACKIIIFPVYAVENFEITVELRDEEITVEE